VPHRQKGRDFCQARRGSVKGPPVSLLAFCETKPICPLSSCTYKFSVGRVGIVTLFPPRAASLRPDSALLELSLRLSASEVNLRSLRRISWCGRAALRVGQPISQPGYREASRRGDECGLRGAGCQTRSLALWPSSSRPMKCPKSRKLYAVFQRGAKLCPLLITQTSAPSMKIDDQHGQGFIAMEFLNGLTLQHRIAQRSRKRN